MSRKVLDIRTRTPGGRQLFDILASQEFLVTSGSYSNVFDLGDWSFLQILLEVTSSVTDAGDTLDVSVEFSVTEAFTVVLPGGAFTQVAGDVGAEVREVMTFTEQKAVDEDAIFVMVAAAAVVDDKTFARYMRVKVIVTETNDAAHTFEVEALIQ